MGRPFTDEEKKIIYNKLIAIGKDEIRKNGVKKTSVDSVAKRAGISKGAFYSFFRSKEDFFFKVIESVEDEIKENMVSIIPETRENFRDDLINNLFEYTKVLRKHQYTRIYRIDDIKYVFRGVDHNEMKKHICKDIDDIKWILKPAKDIINFDKVDWDFIIALLRLIFNIIYNEDKVEESCIDKLLRAQIVILVDNLLENS